MSKLGNHNTADHPTPGQGTAIRTVENIYDQIEMNFSSGESPEKALSMLDAWQYDEQKGNNYHITGKIFHGHIAVTTVKLFKTNLYEIYLDVVSFIQEPYFYGIARKQGKVGNRNTCVITVNQL